MGAVFPCQLGDYVQFDGYKELTYSKSEKAKQRYGMATQSPA
jgi:hypothetical protein